MSIFVNCINCGISITVSPSRVEKVKNICCSTACRDELKVKSNLNTQCYVCKKLFYVKPYHKKIAKYPDKLTCSRECSAIARKSLMAGENNHQFGLRGELNPSFKSDIKITNFGYIVVRNLTHPLARCDGYVLFHRLLVEEYLREINEDSLLVELNGQLVLPREIVVHHKDGNKLNNLLENLQITTLELHAKEHSAENWELREQDDLGRLVSTGNILEGSLTKMHQLDAGLDVASSEDKTIFGFSSELIATNLKVNVPAGHVGLLWSRSGLSVKHKIEVGAGCIDSGYTGEVKVHLYNHGEAPFNIKIGDKIAQLLTIPINLDHYKKVENLEDTSRGDGGFGSTDSRPA